MKKVILAVFVLAIMLSGVALAQGPGALGQDRLLLALSAPDAAAAAPAAPADPVAPAAPAAEEPKKKHELPEGLGGYGGPMISYLWMDLSPLEPMTKDRGLRGFDNGMLLIGGSGGVIKDNFFFGAFGFYGSQVINGHVAGEFADAEIALGGGGLIFELNSGKGKTGMAAGAMLGAGGIMLEADGVDLGPDGEWNAGSGVGIAYPYLGFWFAPTDWMFVQGDIGYMFFELDATGGTYWSKGTDMVDGQLVGGYMTNLKINFGTMGK